MYHREMCTKTDNQINICWSTLTNQLRKMDIQKLNDTYKSLLSASPSASAFPVAQTALSALAQSTSSASARVSGASTSTGASTSASASATPTNSAAPTPKEDGLSGGAIGGIVGGVVGGLALLGLAVFFFWRKRKNNTGKIDPHAQTGDPYQGYGYQPQPPYQPQPAYSPQPGMAEAYSPPIAKYAHHADSQVHEAPINNGPVEMDTGYYQQPAAAK
jgi:MYXO-CTERM domain-containing protein